MRLKIASKNGASLTPRKEATPKEATRAGRPPAKEYRTPRSMPIQGPKALESAVRIAYPTRDPRIPSPNARATLARTFFMPNEPTSARKRIKVTKSTAP